ncbi:patronin isoform X4 [Ischnura elegans]|uniref:patronin isoform X4 n=1 Tax=Ischnura elegans TaxID=197161 RepID=UPI001ED8B02E|nr:patronin isoform X4 [Ischnura elegans]
MWSALSKLFSKTATSPQSVESNADDNTMERIEDRRKSTIQDWESRDSYDTRQAKLRACLKWLLSKAFNNRVPDDFLDPLYKDNEDQYHIKPQLVHAMANAELYCLALSNIYCDPNYHSLNHIGVVQAIGRKGVVVGPPSDGCPLTETILIQTNPLRVGAHMAVLEALMVLYAKEVVTPDRVLAATIRFHPPSASMPPPQGHEEALLVWINGSCAALERREAARSQQEGEGNSKSIPRLPEAKKIEDLKDGACLAALICFYCPEEVSWSEIHVPPPPPLPPLVSDAIHNLCLVRDFCHRCCAPPSSPTSYSFPFHLAPEDVAYLQSSSTRQNLVTFLADLFNLLEIHPVKCVRFPGVSDSIASAHLREAPQNGRDENKKSRKSGRKKKKNRGRNGAPEAYPRNSQGVAHKRSFQQSISPIPDLRSGLASPMAGAQTTPATGSSKSTTPGSSSGGATSTPSPSAPIPRRISHAGRHPSATSQSLENTSIRSSNREVEETHGLNRVGNAASDDGGDEQDFVVHRGKGVPTLGRMASDGMENTNGGSPALPAAGKPSNWEDLRRTPSSGSFYAGRRSRRNSISDDSQLTIENFGGSRENLNMWSDTMTSIPHSGRATTPTKSREEANVWQENVGRSKPITHRPEWEGPSEVSDSNHTKTGMPAEPVVPSVVHNSTAAEDSLGSGTSESGERSGGYSGPNSRTGSTREKKTTFAALPNTTTWLQQVQRVDTENENIEGGGKIVSKNEPSSGGIEAGVQLHDIRLKMEEKRRHIEGEKRRMEAAAGQQRQRVGKAAFLQAVVKGKGSSPNDDADPEDLVSLRDIDRPDQQHRRSRPISPAQGSTGTENSNLSSWARTKGTPSVILDNSDSVTHSINAAIQEVRSDIRRLAIQQQKMDANVNDEVAKGEHFFLHGPSMGGRRTWDSGEPSPPPPFSLQQQMHHSPQVDPYFQEKPQHYPVMTRWGAPSNNNNKNVVIGQQQPQGVYGGSPRPVTMYEMQSHQQPGSHWEGSSPSYRPGDRNVPLNDGAMEPRVERRLFSAPQQQQHHLHQNGGGDHGHPQPHTNGPSAPLYLHPIDGRSTSPFSLYQRDEVVNDQKRMNSGGSESNTAVHAPVPTPSVDDMEPQSISFIGNQPNEVSGPPRDLHLRISSGTRTYRITSPGHPSSQTERRHVASSLPPVDAGMESGGSPWMHGSKDPSSLHTESLRDGVTPEKGFYISLDGDGDAPRRPKPHLRRRTQPNVINASSASNMSSRPPPSSKYGDEFGAGSEGESRSEDDDSGGKGPGETSSSEDAPPGGGGSRGESVGLVVGVTPEALDPGTLDEMERRKERILLMSLQRRERQEEEKRRKEVEAMQRREDVKAREEERQRKREEERRRRAEILEKYRLKRAIEEAEREGKHDPTKGMPPSLGSSSSGGPRMRGGPGGRPRPKTIHVDGTDAPEMRSGTLTPSRGRKGSGSSLADAGSAGRPNKGSTYQRMTFRGRKSNSLVNLSGSGSDQESVAFRHGDTDSGLGRATPPRRAPSPGMGPHGRHLPSPSGPGSLPPGLVVRRRPFGDDGASDISSTPSSMLEYTGPRLYKQPTTKSNRSIILNAVEYCVFPGAVNKEAKARVLEEIARSMSKHFLILFRDAGCQFRALYSYSPEGIGEEGIMGSSPQVMQDQVTKLYGTGPRNVSERMFDKFFKYNSGGKCFSQVHTKHLTVTIDAFTIHNSLWQGKKAGNLPNKRDLTLVI